jgi:hypothetical protein
VTPERKDETGKTGSINGICRHLRSILAVSSVPEDVPSWKKDRRTGDKAYEQGKTLPQTDLFFLLLFFFLPTFLKSAETARRVTFESPIAGHSPIPDRTAKHLIPGTRSQRARSVCICEWGKQREHFSRCVEKRGTDSTRIVESRCEKIVVRCPSPSRAYRLGSPCDQDATDLPRASTGASSPLTPNYLNCRFSQYSLSILDSIE